MWPISKRRRRRLEGTRGRTAIVALAVVLAAAGLDALGAWESVDDVVFDTFTVVSAGRAEPAPIVVVGIDDASFSDIGLRWPWPRDLHARLVDRLTAAGAAVVAFDVVFSEPSDPRADAELARSIRGSGRVVLAGDVVLQDTMHVRGLLRVEPLREFREAGAAVGIATVAVDRDQVVRRFPQDPEAFWRVALDRYLAASGAPRYPAAAPGRHALLRYAHASSVDYVSYYQALDPALLPDARLRDKLVLVGLALKATPDPVRRQADTFATPFFRFSRIYASGVEVQAQLIAGALAGRTLVPVAPAATAAIALAVLMTGVMVLRRWRAVQATAFVLIVTVLLLLASFALFVTLQAWLPVALPCAIAIGLFLGRGSTAYLDEARRRAAIRRAFEHYVAPAVVAEMTAHPERLVLGGERKDLTVLFTDLAGFTSLSEGLAPEAVARILNGHLTDMTEIVLRHGGTVDKFVGDAIMAFWGAPLDDPQHARRALDAALAMQARMAQLRDGPDHEPKLHLRIGLNTGLVVVGNMGSSTRFDYTVIGDAVNLASRLESANRVYGTGILLSGAVVQHLGSGTALRYVDRICVKGKTEAIDVYTPCSDEALVRAGEAARAAHCAGDVKAAWSAWSRVLELAPNDAIATLHLERLASLPQETRVRWDGAFNLDSK